MNASDKNIALPSLSQLFEAPDEFIGRFGWMCGYSADASFLNDAAERFTRQTDRQRAYAGTIALVLMLDPGNPQISCTETPGVLHVPMKAGLRPFNLLHAKVALLGFRHEVDHRQWRLRLIVSTGNWTRETLEENLDLAWIIEISSHDLSQPRDHDIRQRRADFASAWGLLDWLRRQFDCRALGSEEVNANARPTEFERWVRSIASKDLPAARFFDSRSDSFLDQLSKMIKAAAPAVSRNYLAIGSGFYETSVKNGEVPSVPVRVIKRLQETGLLTRTAEVDLFVNPNSCQAIASSVRAIRARDWHVRKANTPKEVFRNAERALHAKFLFSANHRDDSNTCNSAWVYFGSGNFTSPGFCQKMSRNGGNLEAGVVFAPRDLLRRSNKNADQWRVATNILPMQWDEEFETSGKDLQAGSDMPDREIEFVAAPLSFFTWVPAENDQIGGWLVLSEWDGTRFELENPLGTVLHQGRESRIQWPAERPRQVRVSWQIGAKRYTAQVPVIDQFGRLAGTALPALGLDEAWSQIASFPMPPDDDEVPDPDGEFPTGDRELLPHRATPSNSDYPIRQMMQLIENIAAKQTALRKIDWSSWCVRLEQSLSQAKGNDVLQQFRAFSVNPLSPLRHAPFRPKFAETEETAEGSRYEAVLTRIEEIWEVDSLPQLGGEHEPSV